MAAVIAAAILRLTVSGRLILYVHPRYVVFSAVMSTLAATGLVALAIMSLRDQMSGSRCAQMAVTEAAEDDHQGHGHLHIGSTPLAAAGWIVLTVVTVTALFALPPATLSSATALRRSVNSNVTSLEQVSQIDANTLQAKAAGYSVKDWAAVLTVNSEPALYKDVAVEMTGFITPNGDSADTFYVSRFVITCCAVDAQPVGVLVYYPDWRNEFTADDWVQITGSITTQSESLNALWFVPASVRVVAEPRDPYLT